MEPLTNVPIAGLPGPNVPASGWRQTGNGVGQRIQARLLTMFKWKGACYPCVYGESPEALDIFTGGGGTNASGTKRFSTLKSNFPAKGSWPQDNDFIEIDGAQYQINSIAGEDDDAHPWLIYKAASNP